MEKWKHYFENIEYFKNKLLSHVLWENTIIQLLCTLTQIIVILYLKKNLKFWDCLLQHLPDSLLSSTKHLDSPDILNQIYLEGFRTGKTSCHQGDVKYFSSGESNSCSSPYIHPRAVLFGLPSDSSGATSLIYSGGYVAHFGL